MPRLARARPPLKQEQGTSWTRLGWETRVPRRQTTSLRIRAVGPDHLREDRAVLVESGAARGTVRQRMVRCREEEAVLSRRPCQQPPWEQAQL